MATKETLIKAHLLNNKIITSWEAIENYGATRLAAIIFNLRKEGFLIDSYDYKDHDRHGNICIYSRYVLLATPEKHEEIKKMQLKLF
jgi:hypothetical protein